MLLGGTTNGWDAAIAVAASLPGVITAVLAYLNRRQLKTPSGDRLGAVVERAHDLSAISAADVAKRNGALSTGTDTL